MNVLKILLITIFVFLSTVVASDEPGWDCSKNHDTYSALVTRVVDGDTIDAIVTLGFDVSMKIRFRMVGYDSPETWRPKSEEEKIQGLKATNALKGMVDKKIVTIKSNKFGKYRWLGEVCLPGAYESVNKKMIELGHIK